MSQNDPVSDSRPVLIVSDGEEGNLIEKVILEPSTPLAEQPTPVEQTAAVTPNPNHLDSDPPVAADEKST